MEAAPGIDAGIATDHHIGLLLLGLGAEHFQGFRLIQVVAVGEEHIYALCRSQCQIPGSACAAVRLLQQPDAGILGGSRLKIGRGAVSGAIVHKQHFKIRQRLGLQRFQRFRKLLFAVEDRHNNRNLRIGHKRIDTSRFQVAGCQ